MSRTAIRIEYFNWMYNLVCKGRYTNEHSYRKLLSFLHDVEFTCLMRKDIDRAYDGINLRYRFALFSDNYDCTTDELDGPCSVLEMMIALAIRCEETIMVDPKIGDRTAQWFWKMIVNLGLGPMTDFMFNKREAEDIIATFLSREYKPDGHGGLFVLRDTEYDFRTIDIWTQLCYFLDTII